MDITHRLHISRQIAYLLLGAFLLLTIFGGMLFAGAPKSTPVAKTGRIREIVLQNDQAKLRIQRNGVVEITTPERTVFQFWDQDRVNRLFSLLEKTNWSGYASRLKPGQRGYLLTITTEGGTIIVAIADDSPVVPEVVKELIDILEEVTEGLDPLPTPGPSLWPVVPSPSPSPKPSTVPAPSPSPRVSPRPSSASPTPTPTPPAGGGSGDNSRYVPFICTYTGTTAKVRVLSETLCDLVE